MFNIKRLGPATFLVEKQGQMRVPGYLIATDQMIEELSSDQALEQLCNVACLSGIEKYSIAMPDMHWGYGFPIGGIAAMDIESGVISPGGVGYDINCGVRLALAPLPFDSLTPDQRSHLLEAIFKKVPSGMGRGKKNERGLSERDYHELLVQGARWSISRGFGFERDLEHMESNGVLEEADSQAVSAEAKARGKNQLGTIGSGNHFVEIGSVRHIFAPEVAKSWGVEKGSTYILIHSGSRGFGHQVCQDTLNDFIKKGFAEGLPDRQLVAAPIQSAEGKRYFQAMAAAANFAFNNRQQILHAVRLAFQDVLKMDPQQIPLLYDVCHNIAKMEKHQVEGKEKKLCVHRKGATRAFGPGREELSSLFQKTGQPVLVPGDMMRASYLLVGRGNPQTWCSCCHGAGRARSRMESLRAWKDRDPVRFMEEKGVLVKAESYRTIAEEMHDAYKDVSTVIRAVEEAQLADRVALLEPSLVVKG
jgi:tRNA-splicing ligase RtcB (3'-phosphate/5'-hydroxy nucleic acid ligase)